jgi:hypothetical protein
MSDPSIGIDDVCSLHVFSGDDLDGLLLDAVAPAATTLIRSGAASRWWFLRYWNGGRHLRVRLRIEPGTSESVARRFTELVGSELVTVDRGADASERYRGAAAAWALSSGEPLEELQEASIQLRPYQFDGHRYGAGGQHLRDDLEAHHIFSSSLALSAVSATRGAPSTRFDVAWQLTAAAVTVPMEDPSGMAAALGAAARWDPSPPPPDHMAAVPAVSGPWSQLEAAWRDAVGALLAARPERYPEATIRDSALVLECVHLLNNRLGLGIGAEARMYGQLRTALQPAMQSTSLTREGS